MAALGNVCLTFCFAIIGPASFMKMELCLDYVYIGVTLLGLGIGIVSMAAIGRAKQTAMAKNFNDDIATYLTISSKVYRH